MPNRICTICARGGSKGVKNKNIRPLLGIPLIAHTIMQAQKSKMFDFIAVSSDDDEILRISKQYGVKILINRPSELATDSAAKLPAIVHCVQECEKVTEKNFQTIVDLDATSPLRSVQDIVNAIQLFESTRDATNLITASPARRSPYFNLVELNENGYIELSKRLDKPIVRRQDAPKCFDMNASIYVWNRESLFKAKSAIDEKTILYEMPEERSIDIDSELDYEIVQFLAEKRGRLS
ncbi:posttranslational modification protein [Bacillus methanolicus PB1]|uniref:Posttranslational modification protein n=1 Tax=Bacillus methanolicus PB1 TaxID=997296 RepID=I3E214_BACMT|nr:acylneuraminate cytidylyltransferase family protein [Bacillus methanolicus]EIJ80535.1 posttranslational modification protein [Bacillus methanolicus PB1]